MFCFRGLCVITDQCGNNARAFVHNYNDLPKVATKVPVEVAHYCSQGTEKYKKRIDLKNLRPRLAKV